MDKFINKSNYISVLLCYSLLVIFISCGESKQIANNKFYSTYKNIPKVYHFDELDKLYKTENHKMIVKKYAEEYNIGREVPELDSKMVYHLWMLKKNDYDSFELYVTMILLRVHSNNYQVANQGYELRREPCGEVGVDPRKDYLLYEFCTFSNLCNTETERIIISSDVVNWIKKKPLLLKNPVIKREMDKINIAWNKIRKQLLRYYSEEELKRILEK